MTTDPKDSVDELLGVLILRRKALQMSIATVARLLGDMPRNKLSAYENGLIDPPLRLLLAYAEVVGMTLTWKLGAKR